MPTITQAVGASTFYQHLVAHTLIDATYLLKCIQGFEGKNIPIYAISIQNEPENRYNIDNNSKLHILTNSISDTTYPSTSMPVAVEAQIGIALRSLMNDNGYSSIHIFGFEHNWGDATAYPVQLVCHISYCAKTVTQRPRASI